MKILMVQNIDGIAGSEKYLLKIIPEIKKTNEVEMLILCSENTTFGINDFVTELKKLGIKFFVLKRTFFNIHKIHRIITDNQFQIVNSHLIHADFYCALSKKIFRTNSKFVSTKHGYDESYMGKYGFSLNLKISIYRLVAMFSESAFDRSFAVSNALKKLYVDLGITKSNQIEVIYHGLADNSNLPKKLINNKNEEFTICLVGRIIPLKGHKLAIEIIKKLHDDGWNCKLLIAGKGPYHSEIESYIAEKNLSKQVDFLGNVEAPVELMKKCDIVFMTSFAEGFGLVAIEAFSSGTPIISFDVPALNEVIEDGIAGILVPAFDTDLFAKATKHLLTDKAFYHKVSVNQIIRLKTVFSYQLMVENTLKFYRKVI